jgi:hypothetical protein
MSFSYPDTKFWCEFKKDTDKAIKAKNSVIDFLINKVNELQQIALVPTNA